MKNKSLRKSLFLGITVALVAGPISFKAKAEEDLGGGDNPPECTTYCATNPNYDCVITYDSGSSITCHYFHSK